LKPNQLFIVLIIYTFSSLYAQSQNLTLIVRYKTNNEIIATDTLSNTGPSADSLRINAKRQLDQLQKSGYYTLNAREIYQINDTTFEQTVDLGDKIKLLTLNLALDDSSLESLIFNLLSRKRTYTVKPEQTDSLVQSLNNELEQKGYYFNRFQIENVQIKSAHEAEGILTISNVNSNKRTIDKIEIKGYKKFPTAVLKRLERKRLVLNSKNIDDIESSINSLNISTEQKNSDLLYKKDTTKLYIYLKKVKSNQIEGLLGLNNTNEGKSEINGYLDLTLFNNLDKAERFSLKYSNDGNDLTTLMAELNVPNLILQRIGILTSIGLNRRDSIFSNTTIKTGLFYDLMRSGTVGLSYVSYESIDTRATILKENIKTSGIRSNFTFIKNNNRSILMPEDLSVEVNVGFQNRRILNNSENQYIYDATFSKLWHLSNRSKFFNRLSGSIISSSDIRFNELQQIGGVGSIRGFAQNSIDTAKHIILINEYRYQFNDQIYVFTISDIGVFENFQARKAENIYGFGTGIAILTQSGVLSLSLANGSFKKANLELSNTVAHINLRINF
jgi:hypothetical protein